MKLYCEEFGYDYDRYAFGYRVWGVPESVEDIKNLYERGFLPYSGTEKQLPVYYLCRSVRVQAGQFKPSSENRRVLKKVATAGIVSDGTMVSGVDAVNDERLIKFFIDYFNEQHSESVMSRERLISILKYSNQVRVVIYSHQGQIIGAVIVQELEECIHYWFAAYSTTYRQLSIGMWLMITFINQFKEKVVYLGTAYDKKALYKTNIEQLEFFDGKGWENDVGKLKELIRE